MSYFRDSCHFPHDSRSDNRHKLRGLRFFLVLGSWLRLRACASQPQPPPQPSICLLLFLCRRFSITLRPRCLPAFSFQASWYEYSRRPPQGTAGPENGRAGRGRYSRDCFHSSQQAQPAGSAQAKPAFDCGAAVVHSRRLGSLPPPRGDPATAKNRSSASGVVF